MKKYISVNDITLDLRDDIHEYYTMYRIDLDLIKIFIYNLDEEKVYRLESFISINKKDCEPYLNLSPAILVTNKSSPKLVYNYLFEQFEKSWIDFELDMELYYFLIFKYKAIDLNYNL